MNAVRFHAHGSPEVLTYEQVPKPSPRGSQALIRLEAIGVNFLDVVQRRGDYPVPLPFLPGMEGAGVIEALSEETMGFEVGDRVAYAQVPGSYAEYVVAPVEQLVKIPEAVSLQHAAALMLQGMTAHYLTHTTYPLKPGDTALVHAAAGGVGLLLVQMAKARGARVFGTVSTSQKAKLAKEAGADEIILYAEQDFVAAIERLTGGRGVDVVYDSVGKETFAGSLTSLARLGCLVLYGQASGPVPPIDTQRLSKGGSLFLTRTSLGDYIADRETLLARAKDLLEWTARGALRLRLERTFPLSSAAMAHGRLETRRTAGKLLLLP